MRGRDVNLDAIAGKSRTLVIRPVDEAGEAWDFGSMTVYGELRDERDEAKIEDLACRVSEDGRIEVVFPGMELGRYVFVVEGSGESGERERLLNGFIGYQVPEVVECELEESPERSIVVYVDGERRRALWNWCSAAERAYEKIQELANEAIPKFEEATELLQWAKDLTESFDRAIQDCVKIVDNYLWIGGVNTGHYLRGEDGLTPHIGADGYWYIGEKRLISARGEDGLTPYITSTGYWAIGNVVTTTRAAGKDGLDGTVIRRILIGSVDELPEHEERGVFYYIEIGEKLYDVYAWLEPDGWVNIKEAADIATSEIYGLTKLGTDLVVDDGAPVGTNAAGNMAVPKADLATAGVGKLGTSTILSEGGMVGMNSAGNMMVPVAATDAFGAVKLSTVESLNDSNSGTIGLGPNKGLRATRATLSSFGTIKLGSQFGQSNPIPYLVGIGATEGGELANNYIYGGALQHRKPDSWRGTMGWLNNEINTNAGYFGDMYYSGILTTSQFTQSSTRGLELLPATVDRMAGVYIANSIDDERVEAVPRGSTIKYWVQDYAYSKSEVWTQAETKTFLNANYAKISWVQSYAYDKATVDDKLKGKLNGHKGVAESLYVLTEAERKGLASVDKAGVYLIYAE